MFLYIHWKFDFGEENKIKILYIGVEKQTPKTKYVVSKPKYCLVNKELDPNQNNEFEQVYFSRVRTGKLKTSTLYFTVIENTNFETGNRVVKIYINSNSNTSAVIMKEEIKQKLTNIFINPYDIEEEYHEFVNYDKNKINKNITKLIKEIKVNGRVVNIDSRNNPVEFRFITKTYPQLLNILRVEDFSDNSDNYNSDSD